MSQPGALLAGPDRSPSAESWPRLDYARRAPARCWSYKMASSNGYRMTQYIARPHKIGPADVLRRLEALRPHPGQRRKGEGDCHRPKPDRQGTEVHPRIAAEAVEEAPFTTRQTLNKNNKGLYRDL